ncbi:MAG: hypothetical protein IJH34_12885, partial [Romboutsia sp.]|nr:hypothetical protein [Romboutsia sp.]
GGCCFIFDINISETTVKYNKLRIDILEGDKMKTFFGKINNVTKKNFPRILLFISAFILLLPINSVLFLEK